VDFLKSSRLLQGSSPLAAIMGRHLLCSGWYEGILYKMVDSLENKFIWFIQHIMSLLILSTEIL
jgi:hypothetical protein